MRHNLKTHYHYQTCLMSNHHNAYACPRTNRSLNHLPALSQLTEVGMVLNCPSSRHLVADGLVEDVGRHARLALALQCVHGTHVHLSRALPGMMRLFVNDQVAAADGPETSSASYANHQHTLTSSAESAVVPEAWIIFGPAEPYK